MNESEIDQIEIRIMNILKQSGFYIEIELPKKNVCIINHNLANSKKIVCKYKNQTLSIHDDNNVEIIEDVDKSLILIYILNQIFEQQEQYNYPINWVINFNIDAISENFDLNKVEIEEMYTLELLYMSLLKEGLTNSLLDTAEEFGESACKKFNKFLQHYFYNRVKLYD